MISDALTALGVFLGLLALSYGFGYAPKLMTGYLIAGVITAAVWAWARRNRR
jgi:divalent metal cation (Fe/Co/Zn/Cd) transporter